MSQTDNSTVRSEANRLESWLIIGLGFLQGLAIYGVDNASKGDWLSHSPWLLRTLWGWALFLPPAAQWLIAYRHRRGFWLLLAFVALAIPALCWEEARALIPEASHDPQEVLVAAGTLTWAAVISLASAALSRGIGDYPNLFRLTCRTVLLPLGALLFTAIFSLLLLLWGALFDLIHIDFFKRLFGFDWFIWPVRGMVFGVATAILLERPALVDGVRRACTAIAAALLPVIIIIHLLFLAGLAFAGLEPLWATRHATPLVLTLLIVFFLLLNGTHEDGTRLDSLARPIAALTRIAILLSPIYVVIAGYSLALRVAQYGWSPDRVISACIIVFVGFVALTYAAASVLRPFLRLPRLALPNVAALAAVILLGVAVNSPALSPKRIAAASQEARVLDGRIPLDKIDWATLAFDLGRYGRDALGRLTKVQGSPNDAEIRKQSETALAARWEYRHELRDKNSRLTVENFTVVPGNTPPPPDLIETFRTDLRRVLPSSCTNGCKLAAIDLNRDGEPEMIVLAGTFPVYSRTNGRWSRLGQLEGPIAIDDAVLIAKLGGEETRMVPSEWSDLELEGRRLRLRITR